MGEHRRKYEGFVAGFLERNFCDPEERAGVRCGLADAAHLCDAIAADIEAGMRRSKHREALVAVAKSCGDAIWQMREEVVVERGDAALAEQPARSPHSSGRSDPDHNRQEPR